MFGHWLRQQREARRLTREEFAERIGCSVSALRKFESGERRPSRQIAELIANCLEIPSTERTTFIRVARGDLNVERIIPAPAASRPNIPSPKTNLPAQPTPLIGRESEVERLSGLLRDPHCRLLTVVGPGGIGKTRLAIGVASRMQEAFADGVYFVPLASATSARHIVPVIADAVGFAFQSAAILDAKTQLLNHLREKHILLLADSLEHLLPEPGIEALAELLSSAPQLKLLATSREPLGFQGEWVFEVRGLPIPENDRAEGTSMELFIQRARRAHVGFNATPGDLPAILRICRLVDGMPLAIELAAAWVRTLTCDQIAEEIGHGLDFLNTSMRDFPARHRSMRAVFDHSWKLLTEDEQQALERLSVFRGGFQRETAAQVGGASLSMLSALITKSLIRRSGANRYGLHELIRQYAADRLADQGRAQREAMKRHALYYLEYFESRGDTLRSPAQREAVAELTAEMDNFRAAWNWAIMHHELERAGRIARLLWYLFELKAWFEEGAEIFGAAAEAIQAYAMGARGNSETFDVANEMRGHAAYFVFRRGDTVAAYDTLTRIKTRLPASATSYIQLYLGIVCRDLGKSTEANEALQQSLEMAKQHGDRWCQSMARQFLGIVALELGDYELAHRHLMEALDVAHGTGDPVLVAHALSFVSLTIQNVGEATDAEKYLQESLSLTQRIGYRWGVGNAFDGLGVLAQKSDPSKARQLFAAGADIYKEIGDLRSLARALCHQGFNSLQLDDMAEARKSFTEALRLARQCNYTPHGLDALSGFASLQVQEGDREHALGLLLTVLNHPASLQVTRERARLLWADVAAQLTAAEVETIQARTKEKTFGGIVEDLLAQTGI